MNCPRCGAEEVATDHGARQFACHSHIALLGGVDYVSLTCSERQIAQLKAALEMAWDVLARGEEPMASPEEYDEFRRDWTAALAAIAKAKGTK